MSTIKYGSFVIIKKKDTPSYFKSFILFEWIYEKTELMIKQDEHTTIDKIVISFDNGDIFDLKDTLKTIDKKKNIKTSTVNIFNSKILPLTFDIMIQPEENNKPKVDVLFHSHDMKKTHDMFSENKNYNKDNHCVSLYNCTYNNIYKNAFAISHIKNSNRCLFAYDESIVDRDYLFMIFNKILL
jgi:hypothetical protein